MAPALNGHAPDGPALNSSNGAGDGDMAILNKRFEQFELLDRERTKFINVSRTPVMDLIASD